MSASSATNSAALQDDLSIVSYEASHREAVVALLASAMDRTVDPRFADLFRWKHERSAFGASPAWVAVVDGEVVGYRAFMRWEFTDGDRVVRAVRAVDTATHPGYQGRGIFRRLTLHGLDAMRADGVDFVFNTPNDQSRPGYMKMGWELVGRLGPRVRPRSAWSVGRMLRGRAPAGHWGEPILAGASADDVFSDDVRTEAFLRSLTPAARLRTRLSPAYLRWRFDADLLGYRVLLLGEDLSAGVACFRVRRRGDALEATIGDLLIPDTSHVSRRRAIGAVIEETGADYALTLGGNLADGTISLPGQGPTLVWRELRSQERPDLTDWALTMGDIELF